MGEVLFVTGGARSGKSRFAERLAADGAAPVTYIATLEALDEEMADRIERHRDDRPAGWSTIEEPRDPGAALARVDAGTTVLLDCLSLWVSNRLLELGDAPSAADAAALEVTLVGELDRLLAQARSRGGSTIVVTNEVGSAVVPPSVLGRVYRDLLGRVNQRAATAADRAWLVVAGRPLELGPAG